MATGLPVDADIAAFMSSSSKAGMREAMDLGMWSTAGVPTAWAAGSYAVNAVVTHAGSLWICVSATSEEPGPSADWLQLVAKGVDGTNGADGANGANGENGENGAPGSPGADGLNGWSPQISIASDGERRVLNLYDWTGGSGDKPATGYITSSGLSGDIADGVDIRGEAGTGGGSAVAGASRFRAYKSTNQTISDNTETTVTWDVEDFDSANIFSSNAVTIPNGEGWLIGVKTVQLNSNVSTSYNLRIKDGSTIIREQALGMRLLQATDDQTVSLTTLIVGNGNALTVTLQQISGGTKSLEAGSTNCEFWGVRLW